MLQKVIKVGNSLGVILPQNIRQELGFKAGDTISLEKRGKGVVLSPSKKNLAGGVDAKFMKMVDEFIDDHKDVLTELAHR